MNTEETIELDGCNYRFLEELKVLDEKVDGRECAVRPCVDTPDVTFFRHGIRAVYAYREPAEWFRCGVITVPALSFRETNKYNNSELEFRAPDGGFTSEGEAVMKDKIRTIYRAALHNGHDALVLGAFGCGVFKLRPDLVAELFDAVLHEPEFDRRFKSVVFAILEGTARKPVEELGKFAPFYERFGRCRSRKS